MLTGSFFTGLPFITNFTVGVEGERKGDDVDDDDTGEGVEGTGVVTSAGELGGVTGPKAI